MAKGMLNTRTIRVPDELWTQAIRRARDEGTTLSEVIRRWLEGYMSDKRTVGSELAGIMSQLKAVKARLAIDGEDASQ